MARLLSVLILLAMTLLLSACQNYSGMLERGQRYYEENQYEQALSVWRHLEPDQDSLEAEERVRYAYFRGMTDFRLKYRADARYWLGISRAAARKAPNALSEAESARLEEAMTELNNEVFGIEASVETATAEEEGQQLGKPCEWSSECESGFICEEGNCVEVD